jgi:hypothetical protein
MNVNHHRSVSVKRDSKKVQEIKQMWKGINQHSVDIKKFLTSVVLPKYNS